MAEKKLVLLRLTDDRKQIAGRLLVFAGLYPVGHLATIERPWKNNERRVSCIPVGLYKCEPRYSDKLGHHLLVCDVPGRDLICIHAGNYVEQVEGCILCGYEHADIDKDGDVDVARSRAALDMLLTLVGNDPCQLSVLRA